jgi:DNA-binding transcriptional ArsR family regulator
VNEVFYVRTTAQWKALSHPLRVAVLKMLTEKPMTNERLAAALKQESGKLYFHTRQLLEAGMIQIVETRMRGTIAEKVYGAVAQTYVAAGLPQESGEDTEDGNTFTARLTPEQAQEFSERLQALLSEYQGTNGETPNTAAYGLSFLMHALPQPKSVLRSL